MVHKIPTSGITYTRKLKETKYYLLSPVRWQHTSGFVVTSQSVNSTFHQDQSKLGILVLK